MSVLTSQSFASILAVSEESGGQEDSKFDNPKSGAGSSVSWKVAMDESKENFAMIYNHKECRYCRRVIFSWWQGWSIFTYCSDLFHGGQTVVLAGCYGGWRPKSCEIWYHLNWLKICGQCCPRHRKDICLIPTFPCPWFLLIWTKS